MKLSVIIPCLNEADHIAVQLQALARQCWSQPWEVIVCDNGSVDDTVGIATCFEQEQPNFRVIDASCRRGQAHARNVGARLAKGELLAFCDADDEVAPGWLEAIGRALSKHDFVASRLEPTRLNQPWALKSHNCPQQDGIQAYTYPAYLAHAAGSGLGIKHSLHEAVGGFDETIYPLEDTDYCWRLQLAGVKLNFVPDAVIYYRFRHTLREIYRQAHDYGECNVLLYKKYRPLGMPTVTFSGLRYLKSWLRLLISLPLIEDSESQARWMWKFGWQVGRLRGSIKYRILAV